MDILTLLNNRSKKSPRQFRYIALYYLVVFWLSIIFSIISILIYIILIPDDKFSYKSLFLIIIGLIIAIEINYLVLKVVLNFINGSIKSYWLLIAICIAQIIGYENNLSGATFFLGGINIGFKITLGSVTLCVNVLSLLFSIYLLSIKKDYSKYLTLSEQERKALKDL
jgi:hypothetical protein